MSTADVVKFIVGSIADEPDAVEVGVTDTAINVVVNKADMGRVIGKQGKTANALRVVARAAAARENKRYRVDIKEK